MAYMIKKALLYLLPVFFLMSHSTSAFAYEGFNTVSSWEITSSNNNFIGTTSLNDNAWYSANIPSNSSRNIYVVCGVFNNPRTFSSRQYFSSTLSFTAIPGRTSDNNYTLVDGGGLSSRDWGGLKSVVYEDVVTSSTISGEQLQYLNDNNDDFPLIAEYSSVYARTFSHSINGYVSAGTYDKVCFSGNAIIWDSRLGFTSSSISSFKFYGGRFNWFENNQDATNDSIRNYNQQQEDAKDNISEQSTDDIEDTDNTNTSSLIDVFGSFVGVLTSASASSCSINGSLPNNFNMGVLNFCADEPPPFVSVVGSIFVIVVFIPLAYFMVKRIISEIRSFTNG